MTVDGARVIEGLREEIASLKANDLALAKRVRELEKYVDTVSSPLWKRIAWWFQGYYFRKVGRWYGKRYE